MNPKTFKLSKDQMFSAVSGETVILHYQTGLYYHLNQTGTLIWKLLEQGPKSFDQLRSQLIDVYNIDQETCDTDLQNLLNHLIDEKLVENI